MMLALMKLAISVMDWVLGEDLRLSERVYETSQPAIV